MRWGTDGCSFTALTDLPQSKPKRLSLELGCMTAPSADPVAHQWAQANKARFSRAWEGQLGSERRKAGGIENILHNNQDVRP